MPNPDDLLTGLAGVPLEPPPAQRLALVKGLDRTVRLACNTWNKFGGLLAELARAFEIDPGLALALYALESGGHTFGADGRLVIRFENHVFWDLWGRHQPEVFNQHFTFHPENRWVEHQWRPEPGQKWRPAHVDQKEEWREFEFASTLDEAAALEALGLGGAAVMGFNYARLGYPSVEAMYQSFCADERAQIISFFIITLGLPATARQLAALRRGAIPDFTQIFRGPGQAERYAGLLQLVNGALNSLKST